ncbi:ABC transporter family substrate-binding protein [Pseudonocardia zijingensis]|uniref:ABC transporter family substrate-binding protein n=1 Tax=Pseudonocardia zijingensis TaxID=153376 RepID=A0ABP3YJ93_9PSEU
MRIRSRTVTVAALVAAIALALSACGGGSGGGGGGQVVAPDQQQEGQNDVNPVPRDQIPDGGDLRWPLDQLPDNLNRLQVDGTLAVNSEVISSFLPSSHRVLANATVEVNTDYFTSIELTSTEPQVVTYTLRPEATWDDGTPITWRDLQAQWQALNGTNPEFQVSSTTGYEDIASVERGADDKQAVVTFAQPFGEWRSLYEFIYPVSTTTDPTTFNSGWINAVPTSAGPFRVDNIDTTAQTITVVRNEKWWGEPAKLDRIIYRVVERGALADALANNELDFYAIGSDVNLFARAQGIPGTEIRQAVQPSYNHVTFGGAPGSLLADPALRRAVAQSIDRQTIARALIGQIVPETTPLGNYLYVQGSKDYVDHSQVVAFDPAAAGAALDGLGWTSPGEGQVRTNGGRPLTVRFLTDAGNPITERIIGLVTNQLAAAGIGVEVVQAAAGDFFDEYITPGNFDMVAFGWQGTAFPATSTRNIYTSGGEQNYGKISTPEIDALYDQAIRELDDARRVELGQQIDQLLWQEMPQLPLYQSTGAFAVRSTLANLGARGFADVRYADIGFVG